MGVNRSNPPVHHYLPLSYRQMPISANFTVADQKCHCHPERSEGSRRMNKILRYAQDDTCIIECTGLS